LAVGVLAAGAGALSLGCTTSEDFDPTGGDVAVMVSWTIMGMPPTAETCVAPTDEEPNRTIDAVQLRLWEEYAGGDFYTDPDDEWIVPCEDGMITTEPIIIPETYRVAVYAIGSTKDSDTLDPSNVVAAALEEATAEPGGMLVVDLDLDPDAEE
jgi:hypothetical protein